MKKLLLTMAAMAAMTAANAQTTYNYFDPSDCDANGWLWFDTQEKIDKYCGFGSKYKIQLQSATFEDGDGQFAEPECYADEEGYNEAGELGGEGSRTGAIILPAASTTNDNPNGGGIMMWLPDCAEFDLFLSTENDRICGGIFGAKGWVEPIDTQVIKAYLSMNWGLLKPIATTSQVQWNNIQAVTNGNTGMSLASPKGEKVTALIRNNMKYPLLVQGIKVLTYTATSAGVDGIESDASALKLTLDGKTINASEEAAINVYTTAGALVAAANGPTLDLDGIAAGVYVAKATSSNGTATLKIAF